MSLVELARFYNSFEAGLVKARLEAEDIPGILFDTEMTWDGMGGAIPIRLMVHEDDLAAAQEILRLSGD